MRSTLVLALLCAVAGCAHPAAPPAPAHAAALWGDTLVTGATPSVATSVALRARLPNGTVIDPPGGAIFVHVQRSNATLILIGTPHGLRTELRLQNGCLASMLGPNHRATNESRVGIDDALSAAEPYQEYDFDGVCVGRLFVTWLPQGSA